MSVCWHSSSTGDIVSMAAITCYGSHADNITSITVTAMHLNTGLVYYMVVIIVC